MFATADIRRIEREYEIKRDAANRLFQEEKEKAYRQHPRLSELEAEIRKIGIAAAKASLLKDEVQKQEAQKHLEASLKKYQEERSTLLKQFKLTLTPHYSCAKCSDTGYVASSEGLKMCSCMRQKLINEAYHHSNMYHLEKETFQNFNLSLYDDMPNVSLYKSEVSPRQNMQKILTFSHDFIAHFEEDSQKNLLFTGTTGTGKTFLSSAIAGEIIQKGYTVLYQTAPILLDKIFEYKFDNKSANSRELYDQFFEVSLLIIDDLGTENLTSAKFEELFKIINSRLRTPKIKTIISTNLSLEDLNKTYDSRIVSRIIGNYNICRFYGNDIRLKK